MAVKTNMKDIGWMYHSPSKKTTNDEVRVPPTSQIPILGNSPEDFQPYVDDPKRGYYKDTDTDYIILSKQGGRRDLLKHKDPSELPVKKIAEPQNANQQRCDWFYIEDNKLQIEEEEKNNEHWESRLPDYMVHQGWNPTGQPAPVRYGQGERGKPPFATEMDLQNRKMERFDKRTKLPENRKHGYGIRAEKGKEADASKKPVKIALDVKPTNEQVLRQKARRGKDFQDPNQPTKEVPAMGKLLAMGYAQDWHEVHDQYENSKLEAARQQAERLHALQNRTSGEQVTHQSRQYQPADQSQLPPWKPSGKGQNFQ